MAEIEKYKEWLASGQMDTAIIETLEIVHPKFGSVWLANWDRSIDIVTETGRTATCIASRFYYEPPAVEGTEQAAALMISSLGGRLYDVLLDMTYEDRLTPIRGTMRLYMSDDYENLLINPPPVWTLNSVDVSADALRCEIMATPMRVNRVGRYYTQYEFPVLKYV